MDGGGYDTNDTFFKGAGPISALLNVTKWPHMVKAKHQERANELEILLIWRQVVQRIVVVSSKVAA